LLGEVLQMLHAEFTEESSTTAESSPRWQRRRRRRRQLVPGATVQLTGLLAAPHFNGLVGTVVSGPNENGRYTVDLITSDDEVTREHQTKAFKPDNLIVISDDQLQGGSVGGLRAAADGGAGGVGTSARGLEANSFRTVRT